ncbi:GL11903 [Drosophila persimilis]|uniref:Serine/threonine-protein kinase PLK4 n=1 Tax=Drosophila persimilis TaxID=7234 RepID=PLK4_DROPE|nr:serine/threonine-protein kinase PLK4 [Drosophila persimilis]B4HBU3.1 RecName: Full=Serine/threonine-protein kinase PLK4; AltName: Full=Polo-like kinase 4; Short=PLK-4; AltName: Full=Serine/threonine-protein kinase SAK [Drosophila persimilis]EDW39537.1 GL11903 [Drosophila persimilis]
MMSTRTFGETIEEYEVQHLLGKGGFASVYKARCLHSHQDVAIKMIDKKLIQGTGLTSRVRQEVEIHSRLKHPSVLQLYTFFQDVNYVYLVLELAHNGELQRYMKQHLLRPFTESEGATILRQVVAGLLYLHSHNIMHRDISLSNLLLSKEMHIKIADFGLATQLKRPDERHMTMCGTPNYISPEVVSRLSHGLPADVWSVGCMLYTLLVGRPPFETEGVESTLNKVVMSEFMMPSHLSFEAQDLIHKLLKKSPHERITLEQVLRHPFLKRTVGGSSYSTTPGALNEFSQSLASSDSGIVTFASSDSRKSHRLRSVDNSSGQSMPQIMEEYLPSSNLGYDSKEHRPIYEQHGSYLPTPGDQLENRDAKWPGTNNLAPFTSDSDMIPSPVGEKRLLMPPLETKRLQPTRYKTKNAIMSILRTGEVVLEFVKFKVKYNEDRITDICRISEDGRRIIIYQPDPGRGLPIREHPPDPLIPSENCVYNYENLPNKHWKKYVYAARFVGLVKSKTPKITFFSSLGKCQLMETMTDFEVRFYSGAKLLKSSTDGVKVFNSNGAVLSDNGCAEARNLIDHGNECFSHCVNISNALELAQTKENTCFPVTIGRRPAADMHAGQRFDGLRDTTNFAYSTPKSNQGSINFSVSTISTTRSASDYNSNTPRLNMLAAHQNVPIKRITVPEIGIVTELSHGVVQVQFYDGSMVSVIPKVQGGGITYTQANGLSTHFGNNDDLPFAVRDRINQMPQLQMKLKCAPLLGNARSVDCHLMTPKTTTPFYNRMII